MNPLLQSFHIRSFRGLKNVSLENLGRINLLVGENNSGKTSILESLLMFGAPGVSRNWLRILNARDVGLSDDNIGEVVSWLFPVIGRERSDEREEIILEGVSDSRRESLRLKFQMETEVLENRGPQSGRYSEIPEDSERTRKIAHLFAEWFSEADGGKSGEMVFGSAERRMGPRFAHVFDDAIKHIRRLPVEFVKPHAHRLGRMSVGALTNAVWRQQKDLLVGVLQIFDADITGVEMIDGPFEPSLVINHRKLGAMPLHAFGDGLRKAVVVTGYALRAENGILLLDEAETALHVHAQDKFFLGLHELCDQLNVQVFMTTHSLDSVDAILRASKTREAEVVAYHLSNNDGVRSIKRSSEEFLARVRFQRGVDIR
jgi:energy-coupling factor transporter ATP-binding protein EcfA2